MKRRLVKQGTSTMMISLPSKWIKANKLDKGSEVDLVEKNGSLLIGSSIAEKKEITIKINEENKKDVKNILTHAYRKGFDRVVLEGLKELKEVKTVVNELLLGFELTESRSGNVVIENISEPSNQKYELILKKSFQIIHETEELTLSSFENNKFSNLQDVEDLRKQQDRFLLFCRRLLAKESSERSMVSNWDIINTLMHIEHAYYYLYKYSAETKLTKNKSIQDLLKELKEYFSLYEQAYFKSEIGAIHKINNLKKELYLGKCVELLEKSKGKDSVILADIREIFRIIQLGTSPILNELLEKD